MRQICDTRSETKRETEAAVGIIYFAQATAVRGDIFGGTAGQTEWKTRKNYIGQK
jgi:hypothetical protein